MFASKAGAYPSEERDGTQKYKIWKKAWTKQNPLAYPDMKKKRVKTLEIVDQIFKKLKKQFSVFQNKENQLALRHLAECLSATDRNHVYRTGRSGYSRNLPL